MRITILSENTAKEPGLTAEHGLSVLVEREDAALLFDTGDSGCFIDNAALLRRDLSRVRGVALSHNHYDHTRGYLRFVREFGTDHILYLSQHFFCTHLWDDGEVRGCYVPTTGPLSAAKLSELFATHRLLYRDVSPLDEMPGAYLVNNLERTVDFETPDETNFVYEAGEYRLDMYRDEQALVLESPRGLIILTGCAHTGVCNIIETVKRRFSQPVFAVLGGTHLIARGPQRLQNTLHYLKASGIQFIGGCHCTGEEGLQAFREHGLDTPGCGFTMEL